MTKHITQTRLKEVLNYDQKTGVFRWRVQRGRQAAGTLAGSTYQGGHRHIMVDNTTYLASRLAWLYMTGTMPAATIDHENRNPADDRIDNLRPATMLQQSGNQKQRSDSTTPYKGVKRNGPNWAARLSGNHIGQFRTPKKAARAYDKAAREKWGEFAHTNFSH